MSADARVLVTGASGFIGRALVRALVGRGLTVIGVDLLPFPDASIQCVVGDLTAPGIIGPLFEKPLEAVFHLAAKTSVLQSMTDPQGVYRTNVEVTQSLLESCRSTGVPSFVLASTNAVVGNSVLDLMHERSPLRPLTPYGATKAAAEMLCSAYGHSYGLGVSAVRMTNVYGPGMGRKDSFIVRLLRAAALGTSSSGVPAGVAARGQIEIYGDGRQSRDYLYVDDAVAGLLLAWDRKHQGPLTIGSGESLDVLEVHRLASLVTGSTIAIRHRPAPAGEMPAVRVDLGLARSLGFQPRFDLARGLASTWEAIGAELAATVRA
jgi:UDP-glucose 4-epimerase